MIDSNTHLYCILGKPVRHSKSPVIHNAWFEQHGINAAYLAFEIEDLSQGVSAMKSLGIKGASITIPFKADIMAALDWIDDDARNIGAVNTLVHRNGQLLGYNTDYRAAVSPLTRFGIKDKTICIIGAGGAAQAVAYGIHKEKGHLIIVNRNKDRGKQLAAKYNARFIPLEELGNMTRIQADIIINTTSVGMTPDIESLAFPSHLLRPQMIVMDVVYTPLKTCLLSKARQKGCTAIDGLSMFLHQGAAQFELWTGISPDIQLVRQALINGEN